jgi:hypothetical protein
MWCSCQIKPPESLHTPGIRAGFGGPAPGGGTPPCTSGSMRSARAGHAPSYFRTGPRTSPELARMGCSAS